MKMSYSGNSLSDLSQNDPTCLICLELTTEMNEPLINGTLLRACGCHFLVHPSCWNTWLLTGKEEYDCPICRRAIIRVIVKEDDAPSRRIRAESFPYADERFVCCCELPESNKMIMCLIIVFITIAILATLILLFNY